MLAQRKIDVWYDALLRLDADWRDEVVKHLKESKVMVILLSAAALQSDELKKELAVASQEKVPVLAARLEEIKPTAAFAYELARVTWFDLFDDPDRRLEQLAGLIEGLVRGATPAPAPTTMRAPEPVATPAPAPTAAAAPEPIVTPVPLPKWYGIALPKNITRNNPWLVSLFGSVAFVQFWLYAMVVSPTSHIVDGPLKAFGYSLVAATVGSPALLYGIVVKDDVTVRELPLLVTALVNSVLLIWLLRNLCSLIYHKLFFNTRKV